MHGRKDGVVDHLGYPQHPEKFYPVISYTLLLKMAIESSLIYPAIKYLKIVIVYQRVIGLISM